MSQQQSGCALIASGSSLVHMAFTGSYILMTWHAKPEVRWSKAVVATAAISVAMSPIAMILLYLDELHTFFLASKRLDRVQYPLIDTAENVSQRLS
jgi:uncharacterized membrane protein YfcA